MPRVLYSIKRIFLMGNEEALKYPRMEHYVKTRQHCDSGIFPRLFLIFFQLYLFK